VIVTLGSLVSQTLEHKAESSELQFDVKLSIFFNQLASVVADVISVCVKLLLAAGK
jgi:hypothetical protein